MPVAPRPAHDEADRDDHNGASAEPSHADIDDGSSETPLSALLPPQRVRNPWRGRHAVAVAAVLGLLGLLAVCGGTRAAPGREDLLRAAAKDVTALLDVEDSAADLATCGLDVDEAIVWMSQSMTWIRFAMDKCNVTGDLFERTECATTVITVIASFGWSVSYIVSTFDSCTEQDNLGAACGASLAGVFAGFSEYGILGVTVVRACGYLGVNPNEVLAEGDEEQEAEEVEELEHGGEEGGNKGGEGHGADEAKHSPLKLPRLPKSPRLPRLPKLPHFGLPPLGKGKAPGRRLQFLGRAGVRPPSPPGVSAGGGAGKTREEAKSFFEYFAAKSAARIEWAEHMKRRRAREQKGAQSPGPREEIVNGQPVQFNYEDGRNHTQGEDDTPEPRGAAISQCIVSIHGGLSYLARAGLQIYYLSQECASNDIEEKKSCALDILNTISSFGTAALFLSEMALDCPEVPNFKAECATTIADFVANTAALGPIINGVNDDCTDLNENGGDSGVGSADFEDPDIH